MPLLRFNLVAGRTDGELKSLLDAAHRAIVEAFGVPERDRYQIVHEHRASRMIIEDTGLGIPRTDKVVFLQVTTRKRKKKQKEDFYRLLCKELEKECGISPSDVVVSFVENGDEDWSFGLGRAQFLTGDL
jgi:Tautomerase enzyme